MIDSHRHYAVGVAGYSGTPLIKKLGMKPGMRGSILDLPDDAAPLFADAPIDLISRLSGEFDYIHVFASRRAPLAKRMAQAKQRLRADGMLWVSWPKGGKLGTDLNENVVREIGLGLGLVDVKVAAVDETWSGLKFVYRLRDR